MAIVPPSVRHNHTRRNPRPPSARRRLAGPGTSSATPGCRRRIRGRGGSPSLRSGSRRSGRRSRRGEVRLNADGRSRARQGGRRGAGSGSSRPGRRPGLQSSSGRSRRGRGRRPVREGQPKGVGPDPPADRRFRRGRAAPAIPPRASPTRIISGVRSAANTWISAPFRCARSSAPRARSPVPAARSSTRWPGRRSATSSSRRFHRRCRPSDITSFVRS